MNQSNGSKEPQGLLDRRLPLFNYTTETVNMLLVPMIKNKKEALGSMGNDTPLACLSRFQPLPYEYFKQLFAQVTNPPIDPFREKIVMSLQCPIGPEVNLLHPSAEQTHRLWISNPILSRTDLTIIKRTSYKGWKTKVIDTTFSLSESVAGYDNTLTRICREGQEAAEAGYQILVLSDRAVDETHVPVNALLALGALHHHLIETRNRMKVALIVETGEISEIHHVCVILGYGADAICPYLAFELAGALRDEGVLDQNITDQQIYASYAQAIDTGISKVMAKMGISTLQSYRCAQIFEIVGLGEDVVDRCFRGTQSRIGGVTMDIIAGESLYRHQTAFGQNHPDQLILRNPGVYHWRSGGESHINAPGPVASLQEAAVNNNKNAYTQFRDLTHQSVKECSLRGQLEFVDDREKIDINEVEPASEIVKRFATGAMSFGSISLEAHTTLAISMNRIGGKSNTGEGGENADRYLSKSFIIAPASSLIQYVCIFNLFVQHCSILCRSRSAIQQTFGY